MHTLIRLNTSELLEKNDRLSGCIYKEDCRMFNKNVLLK